MLKPHDVASPETADVDAVKRIIADAEAVLRQQGGCELEIERIGLSTVIAVAKQARKAGWIAYATTTQRGRVLMIEHPDLSAFQTSSERPASVSKGKGGAKVRPSMAEAERADLDSALAALEAASKMSSKGKT
ncbi:hypothetical protein [Polyangium fumosum]|uniref:Uncharacterized protein n=1 Tax=Polyangium fumosum TaxID=889272 RepID=A0A4U1JDQ1_9BACT|nr:hypothetical protein [Polyangium fumosum]TKD08957.1 hypothetical protein E8A74_14335 [Polyangium fumosum]